MTSGITAKLLRWITRVFLALALFFLFALAVVYWWLERDPHALAADFLKDLSRRTGLEFTFNSVEVTLLPFPAIGVSDIRVSGDNLEFTMPWLAIRPDFLRVIRGDFTPASILLLRPKIYAGLPADLTDFSQTKNLLSRFMAAGSGSGGDLAEALNGCSIKILHGFVEISGASGEILRLNGLRCDVGVGANLELNGELEFAGLRLIKNRRHVFTLATFEAAGAITPKNLFASSNRLRVSGVFRLDNIFKPTEVKATFASAGDEWNCLASLDGSLDWHKTDMPFALSASVTRQANANELNVRRLRWNLDADRGDINLRVKLPDEKTPLSVEGVFLADRLSLTQWFGFARALPPGLRLALDNLQNVKIDFVADAKSASAKSIEGALAGAIFSGRGEVADFSKPDVRLNLKTSRLNLGYALPESLGKSPLSPYFPYPPLTPLPGKPLKPGETGVDYNLSFSAKTLAYGSLTLKNVFLRICQGKMDKSGLEDTLLDGRADCLDGRLTGNCILSGLAGTPINIVANAANISAAKLAALFSSSPINKGVLNGHANLMAKGKELSVFLNSLNGSLALAGSNLKFSGAEEVLAKAEARVALRSAKLVGERLVCDGRWRAEVNAANWNGEGELNGDMIFSPTNATFKNLPFTGKIKTLKKFGFIPSGLAANAKGSATLEGGKINLGKLSLDCAGAKVNGSLKADIAKLTWQASLNANVANLSDTLKKLGAGNSRVPAALNSLKLDAQCASSQSFLKMSQIKATFPKLNLSGDLSWQMKDKTPQIDFNLSLGKINIADFAAPKKSPVAQNWDFPFMRDFSANGSLKIAEINAFGIKISDITIPLRLEKGRALLGPNTAKFYGASMQSTGMLNFNKGFSFNSVTSARGFDLGDIVKDKKLDGIMTGKADADARLEASLQNGQKFLDSVTGVWKMNIGAGSWQTLKNGEKSGNPIKISSAQANGNIAKGVVKSENFILKGPELELKGGGWLNLINDKIDCSFNVNMKGVPDFPLRLYGELGKTKTSIGAGKMVLNAIGGMATGLVNVVGGIFEGAWKIFQ